MVDYSGATSSSVLAFVFLASVLLRGMNFETIQGGLVLACHNITKTIKAKKSYKLELTRFKSTSLKDWQHVAVFVHTALFKIQDFMCHVQVIWHTNIQPNSNNHTLSPELSILKCGGRKSDSL